MAEQIVRLDTPKRHIPSTRQFTSLSSYLAAALDVLRASGYDLGNFQRDTGVDLHALPESQHRAPIEDISAAWRLVAEVTGDPAIGARAALKYFKPTHWQSLGLAMLCSSTLREALDRIVKYFCIISNAANVSVEDCRGNLAFVARIRVSPSELSYEALEFGLASLLALCRDIFPEQLTPKQVCLVRPRGSPEAFEVLFCCPVVFDSHVVSISFDSADADRPLSGGNPQLAAYQDTFSEDYIRRFGHDSVSMMVKGEILRLLPGGDPSQSLVAEALHTSPRNLQRKLQAENTSFRELLVEIRMKLARSYLLQGNKSHIEIAYLLGFSDQSNFARAFRHWFGISPSQYKGQG